MLSDSKCNEFASFFSEKISNIRKEIGTSSCNTEVTQIRQQSQKEVTMSVFKAIDSKILEEIVQHLKSSTCYLDTLPTSFFKSVLNCLEADLLEVVNTSLLSGTFPNSLKTAVVKPLLKKRNLDNTMLSNYRPISNLPFIVKMAPRLAAVLRAPGKLCIFSYVLFVFLLFYVLDVVSITVYDRDTLLNIGSSVAQRKPDFEFLNAGGLFTDTASEPFVCVAKSRRRRRRRKRGKRAGVLVRLRRRAFRPPLPTILLANVQSLDNKLCELRARISYQRETRDCCVICLTETWMSAIVPDSAIELTGFSVHRSDRTKELTGKSRGGGVCFYINNLWCDERNIHSIKSFCSPDLEFHMLLCQPFWLPRDFTAIIITAVYIPPQANTDQALKELYRNISEQETAHPDAAFIITGDFNKANFRTIAPKYFQHVTINTRGDRTLDHC